jgi:hypothetical protein
LLHQQPLNIWLLLVAVEVVTIAAHLLKTAAAAAVRVGIELRLGLP